MLVPSVLALMALYAPQPLLPRWAAHYGVTETEAGLVVALALVPLSIAPLAAGMVLRRASTRTVLRAGSAVLGILVAATALKPPFAVLLAVRVGQGTAIAALLTALMTHVAQSTSGSAQRRLMAAYVAATIVGGLAGRLAAGAAGAAASDGLFFVTLGAGLLASDLALRRLPALPTPDAGPPAWSAMGRLLRHGPVVRVYALVFGLFFVFSGLMNFLPFRLQDVQPGASEALSGAVYGGYAVGIAASLGASAVAGWMGGVRRAMAVGSGGMVLVVLGTAWPSAAALAGAVAGVCGTFFVVHTLAASRVNEAAEALPDPEGGAAGGRSLVNGLYVSIYYAGGVLGAFLPGLALAAYGWTGVLIVLTTVASLGIAAWAWGNGAWEHGGKSA